jgi:hypothetical protein
VGAEKKRWRRYPVLGAGLLVGAASLAACGASGASHARAGGEGPSTTASATTLSSSTTTATTSTTTPSTTTTSTTTTSTTTTSTTTAGGATGPVLIVNNYAGKTTFDGREPASIDVSPDSSELVERLTWRTWGPTTATATGTLLVNGCDPNCTSGTFHPSSATVTLGGVSGGHFTTLVVRSAGEVQHFSFPSAWVAGASRSPGP